MTLTTPEIQNIRLLADVEGYSCREIAVRTGRSRNTVKKYLDQEDFSPSPPKATPKPGSKVLDQSLQEVIVSWLEDDLRRSKKQRHTAKRIFDRLCDEHGYAHSYSPVSRFVKAWRNEHRDRSQGFAPRVAQEGTIEVDFGQANVVIAGEEVTAHMLIVSFPYSNMRFGQLFLGETAECVVDGLINVCDYIGGVPREMVFDNATGIGRRFGEVIKTSDLFGKFCTHYRTTVRFCNPRSGHEKGNVENAVGFLRRNLLVPYPAGPNLKELNDEFFARSVEFGNDLHYRHKKPIIELFDADKAVLLELPSTPFQAVSFRSCTPNKAGVASIDSNLYMVGSSFARRKLTAQLSSEEVTFLDEKYNPVVVLPRSFGTNPDIIYSPASLLAHLSRKPGAWNQSMLRNDVPEQLKQWLDKATADKRAEAFSALDKVQDTTSFSAAVTAATRMVSQPTITEEVTVINRHNLDMLARRIHEGKPIPESTANLAAYDVFTSRKTPTNTEGIS
ncbi:IS21 family transposase [Corynebacterium phocae]|uniref:IS21 family transposase n=1 Tax=Corynebacterium phocae TaxID=161895 RepID=UPI000A01E29D|nr:IS21 family transposase [Corynebacterium phocae]